jgi:zinc protease
LRDSTVLKSSPGPKSASAAIAPNAIPTPVLPTIYRYANGLTLIHHELAASEAATVDVWVKAGSRAEPDEWSGMAHFLEHMVFKGSDRLPPGVFDQLVESRGSLTNAATSYDYAHFFITTATDQLADTLPLLAEILLRPAIPDDEFDRERDVVFEELAQTADNPDWQAFEALNANLYRQHPYGRPILGTEASLNGLTPQLMRQFHSGLYQPEQMVVMLVGNLSLAAAQGLVDEHFSQFPPRQAFTGPGEIVEPPPQELRRQVLHLPRLEQARLMMAWLTPGLKVEASPVRSSDLESQLAIAAGFEVLAVLLTEGRSSRLVRELREELELVQDISCGFSLQRDSGMFSLTAWLEPEHLDRVEAIVGDRLTQLAQELISPAELQRCQRLLCNDYAFSSETSSQLSGLYGYYAMLGCPEAAITYPQRIQAVTAQQVQALAAQYLSPLRYVATVVYPQVEEEAV